MYTMGVDIGSASSKAVILKDGKDVLAAEVVQVGTGSTGPKKAMADFPWRMRISRCPKSAAMQKVFTIWYPLHVPSLISAVRMRKRSDWITRAVLSSFL